MTADFPLRKKTNKKKHWLKTREKPSDKCQMTHIIQIDSWGVDHFFPITGGGGGVFFQPFHNQALCRI